MRSVKVISILVLSVCITFMAIYVVFYSSKLFYTPKAKYRVAMGGRSVMEQWFKYHNWPLLLSKYAVYRAWPIPYKSHVEKDLYLEYIPIEVPRPRSQNEDYGIKTIESIQRQVNGKSFDAFFFKFCFVDFGDKSINDENAFREHFRQMTSLVERVHAYTQQQGIRLILGNALPTLKPGRYAQKLRFEFSQWVEQYAESNKDVTVVDLFHHLTDNDGILKIEFARDMSDSHLNDKAYKILDKELFTKLNQVKNLFQSRSSMQVLDKK